MTDPARDAASVIDLLTRYSFDLSGYTVDRLAEYWLQRYPSDWIRLAVVEALYQGRYKAVSIEQILNLWRRRGKPLHHFNRDFERIIAPQLTKGRTVQPDVQPELIVPPPYVPPVLELELNTLELDLLELDALENLNLPKPLRKPRSIGAIQPLSISDALLPKDVMFQRFYAQLLASGEGQIKEATPSEAIPTPQLEDNAASSTDSEPTFFPEQSIAEFKSEAKPVMRELPIQPFQPSGDETLVNSVEVTSHIKVPDPGSPPIHQFVPTLAPSEFYAKLKAIVQNATTSERVKKSGLGESVEPLEPPEPPNP